MTLRVLTGITTTGTPHLGNYTGAIRPAIAAGRQPGTESFFFLADLHSLVKQHDPARLQRSTLEIAAAWLASGLDAAHVWFYRQSDIPEIAELHWILTCVASKGLLNRAHAYKASVDRNREDGQDDDAGISAGLFMYPVLMAADILLFQADRVPVGRDQVQHIEMARDFAQRFNHLFGADYFVLPEAVVEARVATLPGLDGRKMSKSYDNTIPLFSTKAELKRLVATVVTDSRAPGEPKAVEGSALIQIYQAFATDEETAALRQAYADGIAWGEAKQWLVERIDAETAPLRERYEDLMARPSDIEAILREGAAKLRATVATPFLGDLRHAVGLRDLAVQALQAGNAPAAAKVAPPHFKQYREADGRFHFKFIDSHGETLVQGGGFDAPRDAGQSIGALKAVAGEAALVNADWALAVEPARIVAALAQLRAADAG